MIDDYCRCECHGFEDTDVENCQHCMPWLYPEIDKKNLKGGDKNG